MMKLLVLGFFVFFGGCSFSKKPNDWQYKSAQNFSKYQHDFFTGNDFLAKNELKVAQKYAKRSSNLTTLARVYLGECALNISVGISKKCTKYEKIAKLVNSKELQAYNAMLMGKISTQEITFLDDNYQDFMKSLKDKKYKSAQKILFSMSRDSTIFVTAGLMKEHLDDASRQKLVKLASYNGYKKLVLFWLNEEKKYTKDEVKQNKIMLTIKILQE